MSRVKINYSKMTFQVKSVCAAQENFTSIKKFSPQIIFFYHVFKTFELMAVCLLDNLFFDVLNLGPQILKTTISSTKAKINKSEQEHSWLTSKLTWNILLHLLHTYKKYFSWLSQCYHAWNATISFLLHDRSIIIHCGVRLCAGGDDHCSRHCHYYT